MWGCETSGTGSARLRQHANRRRLFTALGGSSYTLPETDCFAPRAPSLLRPAKCASCAPFVKQYHRLQAEMVTKCLLCRLLTLWRRRLFAALGGSSCAVPGTDCFAPRAPSLLSPAKCASCAPFAKRYHPLQAEMVTKCLLCRLDLTMVAGGT